MKNTEIYSKTLKLFHIQLLLFSDFHLAFIAEYVIIYLSSAYTGSCRGRLLKSIQIKKISSSSSSSLLRSVKLIELARSLTRGSPKAAGLDLYSVSITTVLPRGKVLISTNLQIQLPDGCYGWIAPRSGLELAHHIDIGGGVIDQDYRGNTGVIIYNHSDTPFIVSRGDLSRNYL